MNLNSFTFIFSQKATLRHQQKIKTGFHQYVWKDIVCAQVKTRQIQIGKASARLFWMLALPFRQQRSPGLSGCS